MAFIRDEEIAPAVAGTFLGDFRIRRQKAACEGWPVRDLGPDVHAPVVADVPSRLRRPDFELPEVTLAPADLERLPGSYANTEMGYTVKVDLQDGHARLSIKQGPPFPPALLAATSPVRFRWEGDGLAPALVVTFQVAAGKATSRTIVQPNKAEAVVMQRTE